MKRLLMAMACAACVGLVSAQEAPKAAAPAAPADKAADSAAKPARRGRPLRRNRPDSLRGVAHPMRGRTVESRPFGKLADGTEVKLYRLVSPGGLILDVSDYGGRLVRCYAPDKYGNLADVTLGWNTPGEYEKLGFSMGTLIGRYGNRIANGKLRLTARSGSSRSTRPTPCRVTATSTVAPTAGTPRSGRRRSMTGSASC